MIISFTPEVKEITLKLSSLNERPVADYFLKLKIHGLEGPGVNLLCKELERLIK